MHQVTAKFRCNTTTQQGENILMQATPVSGGGNESWADATPAGRCELTIANPEAQTFFEEGSEYIATFAKV